MDRPDIDVILEARKILWGKDEKLSTQEDFTKLWNAVNAEIREKLLEGKASQLIDVGTFSVSKWRHGGKVVQSSPVFALSGRLLCKFGVREYRKWGPEVAPRLLTAATVSGASAQGLRGAAKCLEALQSALRSCVSTGYASLVFPGIGTLLVARNVARMTFEKSFLEEFERRQREGASANASASASGSGGDGLRELLPPRTLSPPPSPPPPPQKPHKRPILIMGPPPPKAQRQGDLLSSSQSKRQRRKIREKGALLKHLAAQAAVRGPEEAQGRVACNLTSCSRHSRHAATQEPRRVPELPAMKQRREAMEIAEFYRRKEQEKVDKEGVLRLYKLDCEMSLAKLVRNEATKERQRRLRLRRAALQAQGDLLSASSHQFNKAVERDSAVPAFPFKSTRFIYTSMCPA